MLVRTEVCYCRFLMGNLIKLSIKNSSKIAQVKSLKYSFKMKLVELHLFPNIFST